MGDYYVKNTSAMMITCNLPTKDDKGRPKSLILARGDVSRALTKEEFDSAEIQKAIRNRELTDVTKKMSS